ncbi:hypothetical protein BSLG_005106 [Batrachochytrium salamandrivorans]|nr:hypothetical protein BSLG_005106 [Batrachochytrium salamandrivorans]
MLLISGPMSPHLFWPKSSVDCTYKIIIHLPFLGEDWQHMQLAEPGIYQIMDSMMPVVSPKQNFDDLLISSDHPGRLPTDTYYLNCDNVLRTHTSAHQSTVLQGKSSKVIC